MLKLKHLHLVFEGLSQILKGCILQKSSLIASLPYWVTSLFLHSGADAKLTRAIYLGWWFDLQLTMLKKTVTQKVLGLCCLLFCCQHAALPDPQYQNRASKNRIYCWRLELKDASKTIKPATPTPFSLSLCAACVVRKASIIKLSEISFHHVPFSRFYFYHK